MLGLLENATLVASAPGGTAALRALILQLAMRGLLSTTEAEDTPVESLLERMRCAKQQLHESGKLKRLRTVEPVAAEDPPYPLPPTWRWVRIAEVGHDWGQQEPTAAFTYIDVGSLDNKAGEIRSPQVVSASDASSRARKLVHQGTLIYSTIRPYLLNVAVLEQEFDPQPIASTAFAVIHPYCAMPSRFFFWWLRSPAFIRYVESVQTGIAYPAINDAQFFNGLTPLPPLEEQHRIVAKVDELMALCDRLEARQQDAEAAHARLVQALLDSLTRACDADEFQACWQRLAGQLEGIFDTEASIDDLERAVLELAISGRLTRAGSAGDVSADLAAVRQERARHLSPAKLKKHDADAAEVHWACPYGLPERWAWVSLAAVVLQITDGTHHTPTYVDDGTPFISVKDLDGETVSFEDCRRIPHAEHVAINERCNPERGDILICRIGTLGRPTIVDTDRAFSIFVSVGLLKMPKSIELAEYIHLVLRSPLAYRQYDRVKAGGSHTNKLNLGDIPKIMVPLPPVEERTEILAVVRDILGLCRLLRSRIATARAKHAQLAEALVAQAVAA